MKIGIDPSRLRFRQHMANEMAHYAADCWDAEIQNSYGWIECVGCADRSAYDLTVHSVRTGSKLVVRETLDQPRIYDKVVPELNKKIMGPKFKKAAKIVEDTIMALDEERLNCIAQELQQKGSSDIQAADGQTYTLTPDLLKIETKTIKESSESDTPCVQIFRPSNKPFHLLRPRIHAKRHRAFLRYWSHFILCSGTQLLAARRRRRSKGEASSITSSTGYTDSFVLLGPLAGTDRRTYQVPGRPSYQQRSIPPSSPRDLYVIYLRILSAWADML
jgi:hypothetical protein